MCVCVCVRACVFACMHMCVSVCGVCVCGLGEGGERLFYIFLVRFLFCTDWQRISNVVFVFCWLSECDIADWKSYGFCQRHRTPKVTEKIPCKSPWWVKYTDFQCLASLFDSHHSLVWIAQYVSLHKKDWYESTESLLCVCFILSTCHWAPSLRLGWEKNCWNWDSQCCPFGLDVQVQLLILTNQHFN